MVVNPYRDEKLNSKIFLRTFSKDILSEELVWHRDKTNRFVTILEGEGWEIQFDNELPRPLVVGDEIVIPAYTFHRIKRGTTDLKLQIEEH
jgi:hypothetical protein